MKTQILSILLFLLTVCIISQGAARNLNKQVIPLVDSTLVATDTVVSPVDSILNFTDSIAIRDTLAAVRDTSNREQAVSDTLKKSKSMLEAPVEYTASDSVVYEATTGLVYLYGNGKINYQNLELTAAQISMSLDSSIVHAIGAKDSLGIENGIPVFKQGEDQYDAKKISYNFKTRKGFVEQIYTQEGDGFLTSESAKRGADGEMYIHHGKYTTCDADCPHFYLALTRAKVYPGKSVIFGPAYLVIEDVPLPLAVPYGFFPFTSKFSSGFIMPTVGDETSRGFYARDGGYYFAISDFIDLKLTGEIYTKGSWGVNSQSNYNKRYRFSGNFFLSYLTTIVSEKNLPDYSKTTSVKVQWTHRHDAKANPRQSFSASVNFASESYERNNLTSMYNPLSFTQSTRTSSVNYSRVFSDIGLTLSSTFNLSQNLRDSSVAVTLPTLNIALNRLYPFKRKKMVGEERWYEKIALSYTGTLSNSINTKSNLLLNSNLIKDWRNGMQHSIPITASFSMFKYITVTPTFNFTDRMYTNKQVRRWDIENQKEVVDIVYGFNNVYNYSMSVSANTRLYGFYKPIKQLFGDKIEAIRHVMSPTLGFNYSPDFGTRRFGYWDSYVRTDANGTVSTVSYSPYSNSLYGVPGIGKTGSVSMELSNNIEMKIRSERDSTGFKKISLIDELATNLSYNMAALSRPWSDLGMRMRVKLTKSYTFSLSAQFATYAYEFDEKGNVYVGEKTEWSYGRFGRFQGMSQNLSYTFNNATLRRWFGKEKSSSGSEKARTDEPVRELQGNTNVDPNLTASQNNAPTDTSDGLDSDGYIKFSLPWSFSISYGVNMREDRSAKINASRMRYPFKLTHTLNFSGNLRISEGWNINFSSGYDFTLNRISMTTASLSRDLHCASMSASIVLSPYTSYNFTFSVDAPALADVLRWRKQSSYSSNIEWY